MDKLTLLSQINLLDEMPMEELQIIDEMSNMEPVKKGTLIVSPHQPIKSLVFLKKGQVRLYRINSEGKQFTVDVLVEGNIFGETSSFSLTDDEIFIEAMTDSNLCIMRKEEFEHFIEQNPKIALKFINILSNRLKDIYDMSEKIALGDVKYRILYLLLKLSEKTGKRNKEWQTIEMKLTHADIATMVGSTRETVSTLIGKLIKEGVIKKSFRKMAVHAKKAKEILEQKG
ncbi:Crp/Fnr family transcriptional regulator [Alteribacillus bidgolensis]|uniref:CRP/FNR family transcriptional regulator, anaerobic regulatory protein n=1 Tax=Alteribacillus bidgolensis TaxID=930129 RepID=A0A1G8CX67_9BACI|nr:Crp/Fnr family transcriptional regulator [Alteribacillus bidgolensis]SDH49944.1 CRP/FNR family transcriptional regulator, anaerobic regulatory protein [Alteribacillus bidgolensis]